MFCNNCGTENQEGNTFCKNCGKPLESTNQAVNTPPYVGQPNTPSYSGQPYGGWNENNIPEEYKPISMWGYFGYELLFSIPCIGLIVLIVFALGGTQNKNLRNFARSYFCYFILLAIVLVVIFAIGGIGILGSMY